MILTSPFGGRLSDRFGWRLFNVGGLAVSAVGLFILSGITEDTGLRLIVAAMVIQSVGSGTFSAPNSSSVLSAVEPSKYGIISGFLNLVRNSANVTGIALATAIVTAVMASQGFAPSLAAVSSSAVPELSSAFVSELRAAYLVSATVALLGTAMSIPKRGRLI